jgi:5-methylcytosine-specific restriction endonuclease McrA
VNVPLAPPVAATPTAPTRDRARLAPLNAEQVKVQFTMSRQVLDKMKRAMDLLGPKVRRDDVATLFEHLLDMALPVLEKKRCAATARPRAPRAKQGSNARSIPAHVRREVWQRDGGRCTFQSATGRRCECRRGLELDHVKPVALGGEASTENLRLLCRTHIAGQSPRLQRGGQVPSRANPHEPDSLGSGVMGRPNASKQTRHVASEPSPEARAKPRAAPKGNALAPSWQTGRISLGEPGQGGRADCVPAKTAATVDAWGNEAVATLGV